MAAVQFGMIVGDSLIPTTYSRHLEQRFTTARTHQRRSSGERPRVR